MPKRSAGPHLRLCTADDVPAILALQRAWAEESITYGLVPSTDEALLAQLGPYFVLAEHGGQTIGYARGTVRRSEGLAVIPADERYLEIEEIYVRRGSRSQGIGSLLIERLMAT